MSDEIYNVSNNAENCKPEWVKFYDFIENKPFIDSIYYKDEKYTAAYTFTKKINYTATITLEASSAEITLNVGSSFNITVATAQKLEIFFRPTSIGEKSLKIFLAFYGYKDKCLLLEKKFQVTTKSFTIDGCIEKKLPSSMKLGQQSEVIFLFTNKGNQPVTGISIDIKQTESAS